MRGVPRGMVMKNAMQHIKTKCPAGQFKILTILLLTAFVAWGFTLKYAPNVH